MTDRYPSSRLPAFLTCFDSLEFNSLPTSHLHHFGPPYANFLRVSVPAEDLPLLDGLFKVHRDFTSRFRGGAFLGNILTKLLCAMLVSLKNTSLDSLSEERLLEWRGEVQNLMEARFNLPFLLEYLRVAAHALFQRKVTKDLDVEIATTKEA